MLAFETPPDQGDIVAIKAIVEGTARGTGAEFFRRLVKHLAFALGVNHAFVAEFSGGTRVRTLAFWSRDSLAPNTEWDVTGTPCEDVVHGQLCHHPAGVASKFPADKPLADWGIESYLGVPLRDEIGRHLGHLAVFDENPMPAEPRRLSIFHIFANRAAAELLRLRMEQSLIQSEQAFRDLYEEAPIGYHSTGTDGIIRSVNRCMTQWIGYSVEELVGSRLLDLVADKPANRARAEAAFRTFLSGQEVRGEEIELCRKDGSALWVSLWVKPMFGPDGQVTATRSIWVDITDRVRVEAERAKLQQQNLYLQEEIKAAHNFEEIIGASPALAAILHQVGQVAPTDATVLITGETGTGKELIARAIHSRSPRRDKPLIKINCAALPTGLIESELFGHEKGAFSGAIARRLGRFELANGGTIFLDEIGDIPLDAQAKLLRVLQEQEFDRVGGSTPIQVDVRLIAATNRDLQRAVRAGTFREDLFYRLNVFPVCLPPLRERVEDLPLLVQFLVAKIATRVGKCIEAVSAETMQRLRAYSWPGNIRELENVFERAVILAQAPILDIDPAVMMAEGRGANHPSGRSLETMERQHIAAVLQQTAWVIEGPCGAARILDIHPSTLRSRMKKLGVAKPARTS